MGKTKNLMMIEFEEVIAGVTIPYVALFNSSRITEESVREWLEKDYSAYHPFITYIYKEQYENMMDLED